MQTVTNNTNSPLDLQTDDGLVRLPAFGSVAARFSPGYISLLKASLAVKVDDNSPSNQDSIVKRGRGRPRKDGV